MNPIASNRALPLTLTLALLVAAGLAMAQPALAAPQEPFNTIVEADRIIWEPLVEYQSVTLVVSGPPNPCAVRIVEEFPGGVVPTLSIFDSQGVPLPDGEYSYQLRAEPLLTAQQRSEMKEVVLRDDPIVREQFACTLPEGAFLAGYFRVFRKVFEKPDLPEESAQGAGESSDLRPVRAASTAMGGTVTAMGGAASENLDNVSAADFVIIDDLIVDGSACIGFDCVNGESFGFDTLRLKENNLRIKFDDTSTAASFPRNDWQITANDSANGGASKFSIDDISGSRTPFTIEANAPSHSLYVDDGGRIGLGTSTPSVEIHTVDGDTPTLRLAQDGSSGFAPQTWDVAGNETSFFIRDATNGSTLPFRIRPGGPSNSLVIDEDGEVAIGSTSADDDLHIQRSESSIRIESTGSATSNHASLFLESSGGTTTSEFVIRANASTGSLEIRDAVGATSALKFQPGAANNSLVVAAAAGGFARVGIGTTSPAGSAGNHSLDVNGAIFQRGASLHADYVFEPGYELKTIEEQAAYIRANGHLPAVPKRQVDEEGRDVVEIGAHQRGILEELEKAHLYIEQLNEKIEALETEVQEKDAALAELADLAERVNRLETPAAH